MKPGINFDARKVKTAIHTPVRNIKFGTPVMFTVYNLIIPADGKGGFVGVAMHTNQAATQNSLAYGANMPCKVMTAGAIWVRMASDALIGQAVYISPSSEFTTTIYPEARSIGRCLTAGKKGDLVGIFFDTTCAAEHDDSVNRFIAEYREKSRANNKWLAMATK